MSVTCLFGKVRDLSTLTATTCLSVQANKIKIIAQHKHTFQATKSSKSYNTICKFGYSMYFTLYLFKDHWDRRYGMRQGLQDMTIETLNYKVKYLERNGSLTLLERIDMLNKHG